MLDNIRRKDIEFHECCYNSDGAPIGVIRPKPISILYNMDEIGEDEIRNIIDSHRYDLSDCVCDDERMVVMTTTMADRLGRMIHHLHAS